MTGHVVAAAATDQLRSANNEFVPQFANIAIAASGDNVIVAAVATKKIRVISMFMIASGNVDVFIVDGGNTDLVGDTSNKLDLTTNSGFVLPFNPVGWFETTAGDSLDINLSAAVAVVGSVTYIEV